MGLRCSKRVGELHRDRQGSETDSWESFVDSSRKFIGKWRAVGKNIEKNWIHWRDSGPYNVL